MQRALEKGRSQRTNIGAVGVRFLNAVKTFLDFKVCIDLKTNQESQSANDILDILDCTQNPFQKKFYIKMFTLRPAHEDASKTGEKKKWKGLFFKNKSKGKKNS